MDSSWLREARVVAHLDRLRFSIEPAVPMSRGAMLAHLPTDWHGQTRDEGERGEVFRITLQDPACMHAIQAVIDRMHLHRLRLRRQPRLELLEVAIDVYPKVVGALDLERIAADLFKGAKFEPSNNSRAGRYVGETVGLLGRDATYKALREGKTVWNGNEDDPAMIRCYVKRTDQDSPLPADQHRARFEVQLQGPGVPVLDLRDLGLFAFEGMAPMFTMRTLRGGLAAHVALAVARLMKLRRQPRGARRLRRTFANHAFTQFNHRVYRALLSLTGSFRNQRRSPYHEQHLRALVGSVTTDTIFTTTDPTSAGSIRETAPGALTTFITSLKPPADPFQDAA